MVVLNSYGLLRIEVEACSIRPHPHEVYHGQQPIRWKRPSLFTSSGILNYWGREGSRPPKASAATTQMVYCGWRRTR